MFERHLHFLSGLQVALRLRRADAVFIGVDGGGGLLHFGKQPARQRPPPLKARRGLPGKTDQNGTVTGLTYTAGEIGLQENIIAEATTPDNQAAEGKGLLTIKVPNLHNLGSSPFVRLTGAVAG